LSSREKLAYAAFVLGQPLAPADWETLIGPDAQAEWSSRGVLEPEGDGRFSVPFRVMCVGDVTVIVDPPGQTFHHRVHIGQDSLNMVELLTPWVPPTIDCALDVGTGSGLLLLTLVPSAETALGIDINPRAVRLARLNAELNERLNEFEQRDAFDPSWAPEPFDWITWNTPFMFLPESHREASVDGFGGRLGIDLTLRFAERLKVLLRPDGVAYLLSAAPILQGGENQLEVELTALAATHGLDVSEIVLQSFWVPELREFYQSHGVVRFESVMLRIVHGIGRITRRDMPPLRRVVDGARRALYHLRAARATQGVSP
jgi:methylase of polypeptide subunit release factors